MLIFNFRGGFLRINFRRHPSLINQTTKISKLRKRFEGDIISNKIL